MNKSILFLDTNDEIGGVITVLVSLLERFDRAKYKITLCCQRGGKPERDFEKIDGIRLVRCNYGTKPPGVSGNRLKSRLYDLLLLPVLPWTVLRISMIVLLSGIEVIYTSDKVRSVMVAWLVSLFTGRRLVYHIHGMCVPSKLNRLALKRASAIVANSQATKDDFLRLIGPEMERIEVVHNGIDTAVEQTGSDLREGLDIPADAVVTGVFSRLAPNKGQEEFVRAAALVAAEAPDAYFVVAGDESIFDGNNNFRAHLEELSEELGIGGKIRFLGFLSDMDNIYRTIDIAVDAAWEEAFGMVVIEPMAYGRPVVGTDSGGIPEIINNNENGLLVPPKNPEALAEAILGLVKDARKRQAMGHAARKSVEDSFSLDAQIRKVSGILEKMGSTQS